MSKLRQPNISLISPGVLVEKLHYGVYSCYWWHPLPDSNKENTSYFPVRVNQKIKILLNNYEFTVTVVVGNKDNNEFLPGYLCQCETIAELANDPTNAISNVYFKIFGTETRYSGTIIMGWNNKDIIKELCEDVSFIPHSFFVGQIKIFVYRVGYSSRTDWFHAGPGYSSSLLYRFNGNRLAIFVSKIEDTSCILEIYQDQELKKIIKGENPIDVWKDSGLIKKFNGNQLFGIENPIIQQLNIDQKKEQKKAPTCSPQEWKNYSIMKSLFDFHLKRRTIANISWYQLFVKWEEQGSPLIELYNELNKIYDKNHEFSTRELSAWQTFLRAAGAHNISPWTSNECQVLLLKYI